MCYMRTGGGMGWHTHKKPMFTTSKMAMGVLCTCLVSKCTQYIINMYGAVIFVLSQCGRPFALQYSCDVTLCKQVVLNHCPDLDACESCLPKCSNCCCFLFLQGIEIALINDNLYEWCAKIQGPLETAWEGKRIKEAFTAVGSTVHM